MTLSRSEMSRRTGVSARESSYSDGRDDFPTPPWATRAFLKYVAPELEQARMLTVLEPACGTGHMVRVLREHRFRCIIAADKFNYNNNNIVADYLDPQVNYGTYDLLITNPPYKYVDEFVARALREAQVGIGLLVRTLWLEGVGRYADLFSIRPPTRVAVFSRRMQAEHGKIVQRGSAAMSHSWFWWNLKDPATRAELIWLPPTAQRELEKESDYGAQ